MWQHIILSSSCISFMPKYYYFFLCISCLIEKIEQDQSEMTKVFAGLKKAVDKLHFRGHRGVYCQKYCDPFKIKELEGVNTPVCEQTFRHAIKMIMIFSKFGN